MLLLWQPHAKGSAAMLPMKLMYCLGVPETAWGLHTIQLGQGGLADVN